MARRRRIRHGKKQKGGAKRRKHSRRKRSLKKNRRGVGMVASMYPYGFSQAV